MGPDSVISTTRRMHIKLLRLGTLLQSTQIVGNAVQGSNTEAVAAENTRITKEWTSLTK